MHRIVQKKFTATTTKSFQTLYFDMIIREKVFDNISCITHFSDTFTSYIWTYSLTDPKKKTLMSVFKSLINQCDWTSIQINSIIRIIRNDHKISIEQQLKRWYKNEKSNENDHRNTRQTKMINSNDSMRCWQKKRNV